MISPRELFIVWGDAPRYWRWTSPPGARYNSLLLTIHPLPYINQLVLYHFLVYLREF